MDNKTLFIMLGAVGVGTWLYFNKSKDDNQENKNNVVTNATTNSTPVVNRPKVTPVVRHPMIKHPAIRHPLLKATKNAKATSAGTTAPVAKKPSLRTVIQQLIIGIQNDIKAFSNTHFKITKINKRKDIITKWKKMLKLYKQLPANSDMKKPVNKANHIVVNWLNNNVVRQKG